MAAVRVMEVAADVVIDVIAVRNRFVAAARAVNMTRRMTAAGMVRGAALGIVPGYFDHVLVDMTLMRVVEMIVVQIVDMSAVAHRRMAAAGAVHVARIVTAAGVARGAAVGVVAGDLDDMLVDMTFVRMVEVPVVQIVDVAGMTHGGVAASRTMLVRVVAMLR